MSGCDRSAEHGAAFCTVELGSAICAVGLCRDFDGGGAVVCLAALGHTVQVSLRITLDKTVSRAFDDFLAAARLVPEVLEIQTFLGRVDVRLSLVARDLSHYQQIYRKQVLTLPHIADIEALMTVAEIKSNRVLPL
uniref:Lrp/AsnC family transcriptional regulator n=1 Tax=Yoonia sp. TaxID=2212373 RepID=UPI004048510D